MMLLTWAKLDRRLPAGGGGGCRPAWSQRGGLHQVQQAGVCAAQELRHAGCHQRPHGDAPLCIAGLLILMNLLAGLVLTLPVPLLTIVCLLCGAGSDCQGLSLQSPASSGTGMPVCVREELACF